MRFISSIYMPRCHFWCMTKGGSQQKKSSPEGGWRTIRKPELGENIWFSKKALYTLHKGPIENSFEGGSFWNSDLMQIWDTLVWKISTFYFIRMSSTYFIKINPVLRVYSSLKYRKICCLTTVINSHFKCKICLIKIFEIKIHVLKNSLNCLLISLNTEIKPKLEIIFCKAALIQILSSSSPVGISVSYF